MSARRTAGGGGKALLARFGSTVPGACSLFSLVSLFWLLFGLSCNAAAHQNTSAFGRLEVDADRARLTLSVRYDDWDQVLGLDLDGDGAISTVELQPSAAKMESLILASVHGWHDETACSAEVAPPELGVRHGKPYVTSIVSFACGDRIRFFTLRYDLFTRLHPGHRLMASIRSGEAETTHLFLTDPEQPAEYGVAVQGPPRGLLQVLTEFIGLGVEHIFTGYDHILFLLALVIVGRSLIELVTIATAFTVAHSVTLALAALQVVNMPPGIVEVAIALSIVAVAAENLVLRRPSVRRRVVVTFLFGLVHGFGFAGVLAEMDITGESLLTSLVGFNLGVEMGQVVIVALCAPGLRWLRNQTFRDRVVRVVSGAILIAGLWWLLERVPGLAT